MSFRIDKGVEIPRPLYFDRGVTVSPEVVRRRQAQYQKERAAKHKAQGLCIWGGGRKHKAAKGHVLCRTHLKEMRERTRERSAAQKDKGLCRQCDRPVLGNMALCLVHRKGEGLPFVVLRGLKLWREQQEQERRALEREHIYESLHLLDERRQEVIRPRYPQDGSKGLTLQEIGDKLGVTREYIRQLEEQAMLKIEKGIPLPNPNGKHQEEVLTTLKAMKIGDSFTVPTISMKTLVFHYAKALNAMLVSRAEGDGYRVWMVSKGEKS